MPRDKLLKKGISALSDSELIALLINVGSKEKTAIELAKEVLCLAEGNLNELGKLSLNDLQRVKGMGEAKSTFIVAALELGRRRYGNLPADKVIIKSSKDIATYLKVMLKDLSHEVFAVVYLNRANKITHFEIISQGGITGTVADPRIILKRAVEKNACSLILTHNHPSGSLLPSKSDEEITSKIKMAASYFDIKILDHLIVSDEGYFSFADDGLI